MRLSPDDRWIAYSTNETGGDHDEAVVRPFPNVNDGWWRVSTCGGIEPTWRNDGRELFYLDPDGVMSVSVHATDQAFGFDPPAGVVPDRSPDGRLAGAAVVLRQATASGS